MCSYNAQRKVGYKPIATRITSPGPGVTEYHMIYSPKSVDVPDDVTRYPKNRRTVYDIKLQSDVYPITNNIIILTIWKLSKNKSHLQIKKSTYRA